MEGIRDKTGEAFGEGRWMTCSELARTRGIGRESAAKLVQRERWRRQPGNDRNARVLVPIEWLKSAKTGEGIPEAVPESFGDVMAYVKARAEVADRRAEEAEAARVAAESRADIERARADRVEARAEAERARADDERGKATTAERRAAKAEHERDQLLASHNRALLEVETVRTADRARRSARRMARLKAAWHGE